MSSEENSDEYWMAMAIEEGKKGVGLTAPNPAVGAVVVRDGVRLGVGFHRRAGEAHAEVNAFAAVEAGESLLGATLYVTLEPCSTEGRSGSCCRRILEAGISRVVVGSTDPNPSHRGKGLTLLRYSGVEVVAGVKEGECDWLIRGFRKVQESGRPWVTVKAAVSLDGRMTRPEGEGQWITGEAARSDVARLRGEADAILIGGETARCDDPRLDVRGAGRGMEEQPKRVVLTRRADWEFGERFMGAGLEERVLRIEGDDLVLGDVLGQLAGEGVNHLLVEAGGGLLKRFFADRLVDEVVWYVAPRYCGAGVSASGEPEVLMGSVGLRDVSVDRVGDDVRISGVVA